MTSPTTFASLTQRSCVEPSEVPADLHRIGFVLYPDCTLIDFAGATQIFAFSGFECVWYAETLDPITTSEGVQVQPRVDFQGNVLPSAPFSEADPPDPRSMDVVFVPGGGGSGVAGAMENDALLAFLRTSSAQAQWRGSVCVGAFILWASGVPCNTSATTYWSLVPTLEAIDSLHVPPYFPRWNLNEDQKIFTGGGASSSMDLALDLVRRFAGTEVAQKGQLSVQYQPRPPVDSGDPTVASPDLVDEVRDHQQFGFIGPIQEAVAAIQKAGGPC